MTHITNLYAGWWVYGALVGLGLMFVLVSLGGAGVWLGLIWLAVLITAAIYALHVGLTPTRKLSAVLSAKGVTLAGQRTLARQRTMVEPGAESFFAWDQIKGVRLRPQPGYWQTAILTESDPETWLQVGHSSDLAEQIAEIAGLTYDEQRKTPLTMGVEHYWG